MKLPSPDLLARPLHHPQCADHERTVNPDLARAHLVAQTGSARRSNTDQIVDLFQNPALITLGKVLDASDRQYARKARGRGRPAHHSTRALLAVATCARVTGSMASALATLDSGDTWDRWRAAYERLPGEDTLAATPPSRDHVQEFRKKVLSRPGLLEDLRRAFTDTAVRQARRLGHLTGGCIPEWTIPDARHTVFGDGTILKPYSDVVEVPHPVTGEPMYLGSRAGKGAPKIQREVRQFGADDKLISGINFVSLQTRTAFGPVVLGIGAELGAEMWTVLDLIDTLVEHAGDGVHALVYDGAITGWTVDHLMARHRIQVLGKVPAASDASRREKTFGLSATIAAKAADLGKAPSELLARVLRNDLLAEIYHRKAPQPVGTSIYPTTAKDKTFDVVYSHFEFLTTTHPGSDGQPCPHDLVVDDGALFAVGVDPVTDRLVKQTYLRCQSARPFQAPGGSWGTTSTYQVPCGKGTFEYSRTWHPQDTRYTRDSPRSDRAPQDSIGWRLRPVPRWDTERFAAVDRDRNDIESYNAWFKRSMPGKQRERAASLTLAGQLLDALLAGVVRNSNTWSASQS